MRGVKDETLHQQMTMRVEKSQHSMEPVGVREVVPRARHVQTERGGYNNSLTKELEA